MGVNALKRRSSDGERDLEREWEREHLELLHPEEEGLRDLDSERERDLDSFRSGECAGLIAGDKISMCVCVTKKNLLF